MSTLLFFEHTINGRILSMKVQNAQVEYSPDMGPDTFYSRSLVLAVTNRGCQVKFEF